MAKLYFRVASDWQEVVRLRQEINQLKAVLKTMDSTRSPAAFKTLNNQLSEATKKMDGMVMEAAKAGAKIEGGFKKKIFDASQVVNGLSEKITLQRGVIQQLKNELAGLKDKYKEALKIDGDVNGLGTKIKSVNAKLSEQKSVLFGLTQQQANARLNVKKLRDEYELYNNEGKEVNDTNESLALSWKKVIGVLGGATALKAFVSEMVNVRGQFQQLEIAFGTMLKSKEKADKLMSELVDIAAKTPFDLQGVASSAKQMLAYGSSVENVGKELVMLGNVAAGVGAQLGDIAYLYGTLRTQGRAYAVDIRQFAGRGIPIYEELAKVMGVTKDAVSDLVTQGKVGFKEVEQAFQNMTKEGGMYFNLMEEQSKSLTGQISNLGDAWDSMLNEMGKKGEGVFYTAISAAKGLIENYEKAGKVITGLIATYGAYRTAIMLSTVATSKHTLVEVTLTNVRVIARKAQMALNAAMLTNPYVALAVVVGGLATAMWTMHDSTTAAARAQKEYNDIKDAASEKEEKHKQKIEELLTAARDESLATLTRKNSLEELQKEYPKIFEQYDIEKLKLEDILKLKQKINEEDLKRSVQGRKDDYNTLKQTVANQRRYLQLFDNHDLRKNMSDADIDIWKMFAGKQSYVQVREQMEKNSELLKKYQKDILDDNISAYKSNLENYSKERLEAELKLAQSSASKRNGFAVNGMMVKGGDLESIISSINGALAKKKSPTTYKQDLAKAKKEWEDAKKKLSEIEKNKVKFTSKQYGEAKKLVETTEKSYKDLGGITGSALTKQEKEADKELKKQEKISEQLLAMKRKNQQEEINLMAKGAEKKKAQADLDFQNALDTLESQEKEWRKAQNGKLTDEQKDELSKSEENAYKNYEKTVKEITKAKIDEDKRGWQEYYIAYGEYSEKRKAIEEKYNDELSKVEIDSPQYATLIAQRKKELDDLDETLMKDSGLWGDFFSDFSNRSSSAIKSLIVDIQKLIDYMNGVEGAQIPSIFKDDENVMKSINEAMSNPEAAQKFVKNLKGSLGKFKKMVEKDNPFELISKGFKEKDSKSLEDGFNGIAAAASELGNIMEGLGVKSDSAIGKMTSAISGTASMAAQGAAIGGPWGAAIGGALGLATSLVGMFGADYSQYNKMKEEYDSLIDVWDILIDKKREYIDISYGDEARKAGQEALDLLNKKSESNRVLGVELLNSGSSKGSHSIGVRQRKRMNQQGWDELRNAAQKIGFDYNSVAEGRMTGLFDLSAEQLERLQEEAPTFWSKLNDDVKGYLQNIIDCEDEIGEMKKQMNETFTGVSFDSFYDGFVSMLSDMSKSGKDMADDFGEDIKNAILSNLIANNYRKKIEDLYNEWAKKSDSNGDGIFDLDPKEADDLKDAQKSLIEQMIAERDALADAFGWTDSAAQQEASRGFGAEMTHEDAGELSGRFAALQVTGEEIKVYSVEQTKSLNILTLKADALLSTNVEMKNIADDTRSIIANSYLELVQISENTGAIVRPIQQMQKDMEEVKRNTSRL